MSHHYVSQFHLKQFLDPASIGTADPWLWLGDVRTGAVKRRAVENVGVRSNLFTSTVESHLAQEIEAPAARVLRSRPWPKGALPPEIGRYLAWAAARSIVMRELYESWIEDDCIQPGPVLEELPKGFQDITAAPSRMHRMLNPQGGAEDVATEQVDSRRVEGWKLLLEGQDFSELVHLQAWYFQIRFFPRLAWALVHAPASCEFIVGDRPVVWGFADAVGVKPAYLRHRNVQLFASLTPALALFAQHASAGSLPSLTYAQVNAVIAGAAQSWIAGRSEAGVAEALSARLQIARNAG